MFVKGRIWSRSARGSCRCRARRLLNWDIERNTAEVFVVKGNRADKREVRTGTSNHVTVEVVSGVEPGEKVVTRGGFALRPGDPVAVPAGEGA